MKERPILFSGEMVRAIIEGRKTQTRRIVKPQPVPCYRHNGDVEPAVYESNGSWYANDQEANYSSHDTQYKLMNPPFQPGDLLWVRETFLIETSGCYRYDAEGLSPGEFPEWLQRGSQVHYKSTTDLKSLGLWKPSIHMPRWASRITLKVTSVRVERLNEISHSDIIAEGTESSQPGYYTCSNGAKYTDYQEYEQLWESIYGEGSWSANPWVWVIEFEVTE